MKTLSLLIVPFALLQLVHPYKEHQTLEAILKNIPTAKEISLEKKARMRLRQDLSKVLLSESIRKLFSDVHEAEKFLVKSNVSENCSTALMFALTKDTEWSNTMFDALGKVPASIKFGDDKWVGGFEECLQNQPPSTYPDNHTGPRTDYYRLAIYTPFQENNISVLITYGLCVPDVCNEEDLSTLLDSLIQIGGIISPIFLKTVVYIIKVPRNQLPWSSSAIAMLALSSFFGLLMFIGTVIDVFKVQSRSDTSHDRQESLDDGGEQSKDTEALTKDCNSQQTIQNRIKSLKTWERFLISFSVYTNTVKIMDISQQPGRLNCLDGIRFLSMTWVILGHTALFSANYIKNKFYLLELLTGTWTYAPIYNSIYSVDSFFILSGLLTAYLSLKEFRRNGVFRVKFWILYYLHRFWRLTPPMMLFLGFFTSLLPYISRGPYWPYAQGLAAHMCEKFWWRNLLYINNLFPRPEDCMGWTWYLAVDMQFHFIAAPGIMIAMHFLGLVGCLTTVPVILVSMIIIGVTARNNGQAYSNVLSDGDNIYFMPWCRIGAYAVGLVVGCLYAQYEKRRWRLHRILVVIGWLIAFAFGLVAVYGVVEVVGGSYVLSDVVNAFYVATHRLVWSLALGWLIFACLTGNGGWINSFLSSKFFIPLSRLTYCAYLVHPVVVNTVFMSFQDGVMANTVDEVYWFLGNLVISYIVAFLLSISAESPFIGMEKILLGK